MTYDSEPERITSSLANKKNIKEMITNTKVSLMDTSLEEGFFVKIDKTSVQKSVLLYFVCD